MTDYAIGPISRIEMSAGLLAKIAESAADRSLTGNQSKNAAELTATIREAVRELPGGGGDYVRSMARDLEGDVTPETIRVAREIAKVVSFQAMRAQRDAFVDVPTRTVESSRLAGDSFRAMAQAAYNGNAQAQEFGFTVRALQSAGGSAIASDFATQLIVYQRTLSPLVDPSVVRIVARTDGAPYIQPRLTADVSAGGTTTSEAGNLTLLDPTISAVTITPAKRGAITVVSSELLEDNDVDLERHVIESAGRAIGIALGTALSATLVAGITNGGTASGTATYGASASFFGWGDLATLYTAVPASARAVGSWLVSTDAFAKLWKLRDDNNQPVLYSMAGDSTPRLFGRPVYEDPGLAAVGSASKSVVFGDLRQALTVVRRSPIRVEVSKDAYFGTDQVGIRVIDRSAGAVIDATAAAYLVSANT